MDKRLKSDDHELMAAANNKGEWDAVLEELERSGSFLICRKGKYA